MTDQCRAKARRRAEGIKCPTCGTGNCQATQRVCPLATPVDLSVFGSLPNPTPAAIARSFHPSESILTRDDGTPAQVGDKVRINGGFIHFDPPTRCTQCGSCGMERYCSCPTCGVAIPNRLFGVEINHEGDAI